MWIRDGIYSPDPEDMSLSMNVLSWRFPRKVRHAEPGWETAKAH